ncbi:MAG: outer membrane beta-barrel protein [Alphaproteobacteria bacterium]|nr:outer membrane beta-barrel protein [Alphaproteobacteria bacterium]
MLRNRLMLAAAAVALASVFSVPALADDAAGQSPWQIRARAIYVVPDESAKITVIGGDVSVDDAVVPEVDVTYFLDNNWSLELIAATTEHNVKHTPTGIDLGSVWLLPPTLTAQYHFDVDGPIRPYVGAGINYTIFYNVDDPAGFDIKYENRFGWALQAGVDIPFGDQGYFFNLDVKKLFLSTNVNINSGFIKASVDLNPWIVGAGVGLRL